MTYADVCMKLNSSLSILVNILCSAFKEVLFRRLCNVWCVSFEKGSRVLYGGSPLPHGSFLHGLRSSSGGNLPGRHGVCNLATTTEHTCLRFDIFLLFFVMNGRTPRHTGLRRRGFHKLLWTKMSTVWQDVARLL